MSLKFTLHDWKTNESVLVCFNEYSHEGSLGSPGTNVWWKDDAGERHSAFVKESPEEINTIISNTQ